MCDGFTFSQPGPATTRLVRRVERLDHDTLVTSGERVVEKRLRVLDIARLEARDDVRCGQSRVERGEPLAGRQVDEVVAVGVQTVEEERSERPRVGLDCLRAEATHRHLERMRAAVGAKRDHLAVEHDRRDVELTDGATRSPARGP